MDSPHFAAFEEAFANWPSPQSKIRISPNPSFLAGIADYCVDFNTYQSPFGTTNMFSFGVMDCNTSTILPIMAGNQHSGSALWHFSLSGDISIGGLLLDSNLDLTDGSNGEVYDYLLFTNPRTLNFDKDKAITGVNIIDDMMFWVDGIKPNSTEPKKINIPRSIQGTHPAGSTHTKVVNTDRGIYPSPGIDIPIAEKHITVIKQAPKNASWPYKR